MTTHREISFFRGDPLHIRATVFDRDGAPLDLNGAIVKWGLMGELAELLLALGIGSGIRILDARAGLCLVTVPTDAIPPGRYTDQLLVTASGDVSTVCTGTIVCREAPLARTSR